jgi:hypothetical protein
MELSSSQANFVSIAMLVAPLLFLAWGMVSGRAWSLGLALMGGAALLLFMGSLMLAGRSSQSRTLYREGGRVAFVDRLEAVLFDERTEPVFLPSGSRAFVKEEVRERSKKASGPRTYTAYDVHLGTASQSHVMDTFRDRAEAEARAAELDGFMAGDAPRLELPSGSDPRLGTMLLFGGLAYGLGLTITVAGGRGLASASGASSSRSPPKPPRKRGGPRNGRSMGRGWKRG